MWHLHFCFNGSSWKSIKLLRSQFSICSCELPSNVVPAPQTLRDGPGIARKSAVLCRRLLNQPQIFCLVQCQCFMNMATRVNESPLWPLFWHGEYVPLVPQLLAAPLAHQDPALGQEGQLYPQPLHRAVDGKQLGSQFVLQWEVGCHPPGQLSWSIRKGGQVKRKRGQFCPLGWWGSTCPTPRGARGRVPCY